jgi:predicted transposase YbfD/YdcC
MENSNLSEKVQLSRIVAYMSLIKDPRRSHLKLHKLCDILTIALCSLLCGWETFAFMERFGKLREAWFRTFLELPNGIPSHDTFNRVLGLVKPEEFLECFLKWTQEVREQIGQEVVALDGKALRRACNDGKNVAYIVSAWADGNGLVLGQLKVEEKSNEITAVPELIRILDLEGCIVTTDAMGCQKKITKEIVEADADYVLALKGNQGAAHEEIKEFMDALVDERADALITHAQLSREAKRVQTTQTVEKDHGRLEVRTYWQSDELSWFADLPQWEALKSVGVVESSREIKNKVTTERRYYLSSLKLDVTTFARAIRSHWGVENKVHWVMDVQFNEDQNRARTGHADENLALLRRLALNILSRDKTKGYSVKAKQLRANLDPDYCRTLLTF